MKRPVNDNPYALIVEEILPKKQRFTDAQLERYRLDPVEYAEEQLKVTTLTPVQRDILRSLLVPPYRTMVKSGHSIGKTFLSAVAVNWRYDCFDPGIVITTAPSERDVKDLLWSEVRLQRRRAGLPMDFIGPTAPEMRTGDEHYAKGYTARGGVSFQGRHPEYLFFVFDEAIGVLSQFWETTGTMFKSEPEHGWLVIFNPTDVTSVAYQEENAGEWIGKDGHRASPDDPDAVFRSKWNVFTMSCLDHPNITGQGETIKAAVSLAQVNDWVKDWCDPLQRGAERLETDFEWPAGSGQFWRPGPEFNSRVRGVWPDGGTTSVWYDSLWQACAKPITEAIFPADESPEIGVDLGSTSGVTAIHARWGAYSLFHMEAHGFSGPRKKGEIISLCQELTDRVHQAYPQHPCQPRKIVIKIDDAVGGRDLVGHLQEAGYLARDINASTVDGVDVRKYPKMRSQLWFQTVKKAQIGMVKFGLLPKKVLAELKLQAMAPEWKLDGAGRRVVEEKPKTEERLGRSPDGLDAINLAYLSSNFKAPEPIVVPVQTIQQRYQQRMDNPHTPLFGGRPRRRLFGQR